MAKLHYNAKVYEGTTAELAADTTIYQANDFIFNSTTGVLKKGDGVKTLANLVAIGNAAPTTAQVSTALKAKTQISALTSASTAADIVAALKA